MAAGRTSWWPKDAAFHRRELIVELGEEFAAGGPNVMDVICAWAQEQRASGEIRGGFRILARESFVSLEEAQAIVNRAGDIGLLDDLSLDADGRRFTCRVSGWQADQERGRAALRQAAKRAEDSTEQTVTDRDMNGPVTPSTPPDLTRPEKTNTEEAATPPRARAGEGDQRSPLEIECPKCRVAIGEKCGAARGGVRESFHLERHHAVGTLTHLAIKGWTPKPPPQAAQPYADDPAMVALRDEHFPELEVSGVASAAATLRFRRREVTPEALRSLLYGESATDTGEAA